MADVDIATVTGPMANYVQEGPGKPSRGLVSEAQAHRNVVKLFLDRPCVSPSSSDVHLTSYNLHTVFTSVIYVLSNSTEK